MNSLNSPSSSSPTSSKGRKSMFSSNSYSSSILPQTKLYNANNSGSTVQYGSSSRQYPGFSNSTSNITSISHVTATPNFLKKSSASSNNSGFHHYISHSNSYLSGNYYLKN